jgi:acetyltransferase-like isoleucine patch superfamily enzyme
LGGVVIEQNAWIGANVIVFDGITVGRDAIVGAGAVVTRDVPPFGIALGVPAKVVRMRDEVAERAPAVEPA